MEISLDRFLLAGVIGTFSLHADACTKKATISDISAIDRRESSSRTLKRFIMNIMFPRFHGVAG